MPFKIDKYEDPFLDEAFQESMADLNAFYEINWVHHLPTVIVVRDRTMVDALKGERTASWLVAWADGRRVFILDRNNLEKESDHKYSPETYRSLLKHELSHSFYSILCGGHAGPLWLCEGVAIYTAGQNKEKKLPSRFEKFLEFYSDGGKGVYAEPGFVVELLVKEFGKMKLLGLIKEFGSVRSRDDFTDLFVKTYGFEPAYDKFNELLEKHPLNQ